MISNVNLKAERTLQEVETCVECSAKMPLNVSEVFYFAQRAVLHPTAPLYDSRDHVGALVWIRRCVLTAYNQVLKKECVAALRRIFKLCDTNKDSILDAAELNEFQVCYIPINSSNTAQLYMYASVNASMPLYKLKSWRVSKQWSKSMRMVVSVTVA